MGKLLKWISLPAIIAIIGWFINHGSGVAVSFQDAEVNNGDSQTVVVCVDKTGLHSLADMQPIIRNSGLFATYDLSVEYQVEQQGVKVIPMSYLKSRNSHDAEILVFDYDKGTLSKTRDIDPPFDKILINQNESRLSISVDAVCKSLLSGARKCSFDYIFTVVPRGKCTLQQWKYNCARALEKKQLPSSFHLVMLSNSVSYEGIRNVNTLNEVWSVTEEESNTVQKRSESLSEKKTETNERKGISLAEAQRIFDMVSNGKMTEGQALTSLSKGRVALSSTTDGKQTLIEVLHEMEMGAAIDDPVFYNIVSFQTDPNTGKIKSGTLMIEKRI